VVQWEAAEVKGAIDETAMHAAADKLNPEILTCYRGALGRAPGYTGRIVLRFIVTPQGKLASSDLAEPVPDGVFGECLITAAKKAKLPKAKGGKNAIVSQPFTLALQ
jgi:TonB family protein